MRPHLAISLYGMRFHALVGVLPHERTVRQPLEVDLTAWVPTSAGASQPVLDYRALYAVAERGVAREHGYLETLAAELIADTLALPGVARAAVAVRKPHVAMPGPLAFAEVRLERAHDD